ncbi:MAG: PaaI family thioesterase [Pseudomonadota bacterium]
MTKPARITPEAFEALWEGDTSIYHQFNLQVEWIAYGHACMRLPADPKHLRPGGTISGPAQMAVADCAAYAALLGAIGPVPLAVTTNLSINFLNKPQPADLLCECKLLKLGRRLAVLEATNHSEGRDDPVSHVVATYSIPPGAVG